MKNIKSILQQAKSSNLFTVLIVISLSIVLFSIFFIYSYAQGTIYYVDSISGNDSNTGTDQNTPWQTLSKINSINFSGGDTILFKKDSEWRGGINLKVIGNENVPVTLSSYGTSEAKPILNGAELIPSSWIQDTNNLNIYKTTTSFTPKQIIVDGNRLDPVRTPNTGYFKIDQVISSTSFISSSATPIFSTNGIGKTLIYFRSANWRIDKRFVTAFDSATNVVTFDSPLPSGYDLAVGQGFYLMNHKSFLDQSGEWFFDDVTKELFVWLRTNDSPSLHVVEGSTTTIGITAGYPESNVTIDGLSLKNYAGSGIYTNTRGAIIRNNYINNSLERGIFASSKSATVENNTITNSYQAGIQVFRQESDLVDIAVVRSNTFENNGSLGNQSNPGQNLDGISLYNTVAATITNNIIKNSGNSAITASGIIKTSLVISSNTLENFCLYLNDCGAIHNNGSKFDPALYPEIAYNIIKNGVGNNEGTTTTYGVIVSGIYLDWYANNSNVHHNTIDRTRGHGAIKLHGGNNNTVDSNIIYQYETWPTISFLKDPDPRFSPPKIYPMSGNVISNNQFFVEKIFNNVQDMQFYNLSDTDNNFGTFINNTINSDLQTTITSPQPGSGISGIVAINATGTSTKSTVSKVEFLVDGGSLATDPTSPFSALWDTSLLVHNSSHTLLTKVHDTVGNIASSNPVLVTVLDIKSPTVSITSPINNAQVSDTVEIAATASDISGVSKVEFYIDNALIYTDTSSPYSASWNTTSYAHNTSHILVAKAFDVANNSALSNSITVKVADITAPSIAITSPTNGSVIKRSSTITIAATASDISGVSKVEFYINGTIKCTDTTSPYTCNWKIPGAKNTTYTLMAKAYDIVNNSSSSSVSVKSGN